MSAALLILGLVAFAGALIAVHRHVNIRAALAEFWLSLPQGIRPGVVAVGLVLLIALLLALWPKKAHAENAIEVMVAKKGKDEIRLYNTQCMNAGVLGQIKPEWREKFQKGTGYISGQFYWLCWILQDDGNVVMIFDDGDSLTLEHKVFKVDQGV